MIRIFKNLSKKEWLYILLSIVFIVIQVGVDLRLPEYMSEITMLVQSSTSSMNEILIAGSKMMLCAFLSLASSVIVAIFAAKTAINFAATLRSELFNKVQSFSMEEIADFSTASLITRSTNDVTQVQMLIVMGLQAIIKAPIMAVWAMLKISNKSTEWTMATGVAVIILILIVGTCTFLAVPKFKKLQSLTDDINRVTRENLTGINVVRAYNAEDYQENKFNIANENLTNANLFAHRAMAFMMPGIQMIMSGLTLSIYWIGAILIESAKLNEKMVIFSDMVVFSSYATLVVMSFMMLIMIFIMLPRAQVASKRILEVLDKKTKIIDGDNKSLDKNVKGKVEFKNVTFKYPDAEESVVEDINFTANKGETIAFIGATGCGKSTLINLVPRFYDATVGEVLVDDVNVRGYTQHELHNKIGYVSQKATLFSGTIKSNIVYGDNGKKNSEENLIRAIDIAQASEFIEKQSDGYNSFVAQDGANFSGGQKQRISIARAIYRNPEILIFDDSFSALDYKTDKKLRKSLKENCSDITKLIVAQRIGTIRDADKIIVLDEGKIVGMGKHEYLMESCEVYKQIALSQLSKKELE